MPRFFVADVTGNSVQITGEDALHLARSLRVRVGEVITVCDHSGTDHTCEVVAVSSDCVTAKITHSMASASETPFPITLYFGLPKGDKTETILQKGVELGATEFVPILTTRCISRPDQKSLEKKLVRWQKIVREAAGQSGRGVLPVVREVMSFDRAIDELSTYELAIMFYENATKPLGEVLQDMHGRIGILTGPEGGFEPTEADTALQKGVHLCSLGPRILRCETAPLAALAILTAKMELL